MQGMAYLFFVNKITRFVVLCSTVIDYDYIINIHLYLYNDI